MKFYLLPNYFKKIGLLLFLVGSFLIGIDGFLEGFFDGSEYEDFKPDFKLIWSEGWTLFWNLCSIAGVLIYALSREKKEDEWHKVLRLETGWITFVICLGLLFVCYAIMGEIDLSINIVISLPVILFLIIFFFRKRQFE